jgi:acetylornithine deacetylase/succinyl-diaminopimelate desuccinylase-like protein
MTAGKDERPHGAGQAPGVEAMRARVATLMPRLQDDLERLVRFPSIAFDGFPEQPVKDAGAAVAELLRGTGLADVRLLDIPGASAAVYGARPAAPGAPTVLLYAHYDVQPPGDESRWTSPPFEPQVRHGRLYGRGASDDKAGVVMHVGALQALGPDAPIGIKVVIEGKEECGEGEIDAFVAAHPDLFTADAIVVADVGNAALGVPTFTTSLRGVFDTTVEVATLAGPVHSGSFGGAAPDALVALIRLLSTIWDEKGDVVVPGLAEMPYDGAPYDEAQFRHDAGVLEGVELIGSGSVAQRVCGRPSITVTGMDVPAVEGASNAVVPRARALLSTRVAPGQDCAPAMAALKQHLEAARPWNVQLTVDPTAPGEGFLAHTGGPAYAAAKTAMESAYGRPPQGLGEGGSIPLVTAFAEAVPDAEIILWGPEEPECRIHGIDESVDLAELERCTLTEALFLAELKK